MKRILATVAFLLCSTLAHAQGAPFNLGWVATATGAPKAGATISICSVPANAVPCTNYVTVYSDLALTVPINQATTPLVTDSHGNIPNDFVPPGIYTYTISGVGITAPQGPFVFSTSTGAISGNINGTITNPQVAFASAPNTLSGSANFQWSSPVAGALNLNSTANSNNGCTDALISLTNTNNASTAGILKQGNGSFAISNDCQLTPSAGFLRWSLDGGAAGDIDLRSGSNGSQLYCNTVANVGITLPQGSCQFHMFLGGVGTAKFDLFAGNPTNNDYWWDAGTGCSTWHENGSLTQGLTICPPASGNPNPMNFPIATATSGTNSSGQFLKSDGANPQILSWVTPFVGEYCGATSGASQNCAKTLQSAPIIVHGDVQLNTATSQSITTLPFSDANYSCTGSDLTTAAGVVSFSSYLAASVTITETTGTNTDHLRFICVGN